MQLCSGAVSVHCRDDVLEDGETVQSMAVNTAGTILAVVTQLHLHFWSAGAKTVYLTSLLIPDTSLDDNPALFVLWRPRQGNDLAVVTARQVVFFEADINLRPGEFLQAAERRRNAVVLRHVDSASRVCYSSEMPIEAGIATAAVTAGPYAFLVTTTAGVVYVVGWHQQAVLHQWTTVGLQADNHTFISSSSVVAAAHEGEGSASPLVLSGSTGGSSSPNAANTPLTSVVGTAPVSSARAVGTVTPPAGVLRCDPLQRRYQQDTRAAAALGAEVATAACGIRPPGVAVLRSSEDCSTTLSPSASPVTGEQQAASSAQDAAAAAAADGGAEPSAAADDIKAGLRSSSHLDPASGATHAAPRSFAEAGSSNGGTASNGTQRGATGAELLAGTILHATFVSRWKVLSFVFSSGNVLLCRPSCGTNFTHSKVQLQGTVTPIVSAHMVAVNMRHLLLAVCTQGGALSCRRIDGASLAVRPVPLWKGLRGLQERFTSAASAASSSQHSLGLVAAMEWSPAEELLCVAFYKHGVVLVHYSGGVVTHHLSGPASGTLLRSPGGLGLTSPHSDPAAAATAAGRSAGALGCSHVFWKPDGTRLWMAAAEQRCFFSTQLSRVLVADTVGPHGGGHTPMALLADDALYLVSVSEAAGRQGVRERVRLPEDYVRDQHPMLCGAVSSDGSWIACAGRRGMLLFNRDRFSWKLASKREEELAFSCVADPVWLRNVAVAVPAMRTDRKTFELLVLSTSSVSPSQALARVSLEGRPSLLSCVHQDHRSEGYVVVADLSQVVRIFRYDAFTDATPASGAAAAASKAFVALTPVQQLVLTGDLVNPLQIVPVCLRREEDDRANPQRTRDQAELRLLLHRRGDHSLVWLRGGKSAAARADGSLPLLTAASEPFDSGAPSPYVYRCWLDRTPPVRGAVLLTHEEGSGLVLHQLQPHADQLTSSGTGAAAAGLRVRRVEVTPTRDTELLPLCVSPFDGYVLCVGTDTSVPLPPRRAAQADSVNALPHPQLVLRPVLYAHRVLSLLLLTAMPSAAPSALDAAAAGTMAHSRAASECVSPDAQQLQPSAAEVDGRVAAFLWDRSLFHWLEGMRLNNTFVAVMDFFLHTALNESPPAAVPGLGRRSAVRAVIALLRNYPEFYAIVVGCVRKIDFTRWHLVLDFLGTPTALFRECVAHHCYAEAVHLVRVIMMGSYKPAATLSVARVAELRAAYPSAHGNPSLASRGHGVASGGGGGGDAVGSLEQASHCAVELFTLSIENGDYTAAYDLLRFMALLEEEIGMPASGALGDGGGGEAGGGEGGGAAEGFLTRWLRQLTFSGAAYDDPDAAVEEPAERTGKGEGGAAGAAAAHQGAHQVGGYATLVLDAARCEMGRGGRSASDTAEEVQRQAAVQHMFARHTALPAVVHQEALRLLLTGYVTQLAKLMETFSFSVPHFLRAASALINLDPATEREGSGRASAAAGAEAPTSARSAYPLHLHEVFDGLHKELGLPRSFHVPSATAAATAWCTWIVDQQKVRAASLPGVLSATNPKVWTVAQSALYAMPQLRTSVESLHHIFSGVFVYNLAFCVLLMRKADLIALLLSAGAPGQSSSPAGEGGAAAASHAGVSADSLITVLAHLEALLAIPENAGYKPFLQDVFQSLPPSALRARVPTPAAAVVADSAASPAAR